MATNIGQLIWQIDADTKGIDKSLKATDSKLGKFGKAVKAAFAAGAVIAFAKAAFEVSKKLVLVASDAQETANKFDVVFDGVTRAADAADNLAESYGLSHEASQDLLSGTADLLQGFGVAKDESLDLSEQVQKLAVDLSSFSNNEGGAEAASHALTSAMLGEREAVKTLGIAITDAELKKFAEESGQVFNEMTKGEKAILTLNLAIKQSGNAIGDFARSQDSFANQMKIARANVDDLNSSLGEQLLPTATSAVSKFNELIGSIIDTRKEATGLKDAIAAQKEGTDTLDQQLTILLNRQARYTGATRKQKEALQAEIDELQRLIGTRDSEAKIAAKQEEERLQAIADEEEAQARRDQAAKDAQEAELSRLQDIADAQDALAEGEQANAEAIQAQYEKEGELLAQRVEAETAGILAEREAEIARHNEVIAHLEKELAAASQYAGNVGDIFGNLIQIQMAGDEELTNKKKKNIIALYRIQQAANIAQVAIDTAAAIAKLWVQPGFPAAIPLSVIVGAIGATQIGVIAATPPPVALASGGIVPARPGGTSAVLGEQGQSEAVIPLDDGGLGNIHVIVNLEGQPIIDTIQSGINRREIVIDAGSIA